MKGYRLSSDDFWNDFSNRETIEHYWDQLSNEQIKLVLELDKLFLLNTVKDLSQEQCEIGILKAKFYNRMPKTKDKLGW